MKFVIERSVDDDGSVDFPCWVAADTADTGRDNEVAEIELKLEDELHIPNSMKAIRALMEVGNREEDSFSEAVTYIIQEAFKAGMNYAIKKVSEP